MLAGLALVLLATPEIDWTKYEREAAEQLAAYLAVDTTNPPGNELRAARFLAARLQGMEPEVLEIAPGRANVVARLKGDGRKKAIILSHHMDVVEATPSEWKHPPFSGARVGGEIWGRGALDMKGSAIVHLAVMRALRDRGAKLSRDVVFLGVADEEEGGTGAQWMVKNRPQLFTGAEYLFNEGANAMIVDGKVQYYGVAASEKTSLWLELVTKGPSGHGSIPIAGSALDRMIAALDRLRRAETPISLLPSVESYFAGVAPRETTPVLKAKLGQARKHLKDREFMRALTARPEYDALIRNTVSITSVRSGEKVNVIPGEALATLDCRLLPGTNKADFLTWLRKTLDDPGVEIRETSYFPTLESRVDTELMRVIRDVTAQYDPGVPVFAELLTSTTDSSTFRALGVTVYGFEPFRLTTEELDTAHGADERISEANLAHAMRFMHDVISKIAE